MSEYAQAASPLAGSNRQDDVRALVILRPMVVAFWALWTTAGGVFLTITLTPPGGISGPLTIIQWWGVWVVVGALTAIGTIARRRVTAQGNTTRAQSDAHQSRVRSLRAAAQLVISELYENRPYLSGALERTAWWDQPLPRTQWDLCRALLAEEAAFIPAHEAVTFAYRQTDYLNRLASRAAPFADHEHEVRSAQQALSQAIVDLRTARESLG